MTLLVPGTCQYCGCHGEACTLADGEKCVWFNARRTVCNAPGCVRAAKAKRAASVPVVDAKYAGWGVGAIRIEKRKERERVKRRRRRAA